MRCEQCGKGFRNEAGEACGVCGYPCADGPQDGDTRRPFDRFIQDRAIVCPIAYMIFQLSQMNPAVPTEQLMMLALTNYAAKADGAARLLQEFAKWNVGPPIRLV